MTTTPQLLRGGTILEYFVRPFRSARLMLEHVERAEQAHKAIPWIEHGEFVELGDWTAQEIHQPWPDGVVDAQSYYVLWGPDGARMEIGPMQHREAVMVLDGSVKVTGTGFSKTLRAFDRRARALVPSENSLLLAPDRRHVIEAQEYSRLMLSFRPPLRLAGAVPARGTERQS